MDIRCSVCGEPYWAASLDMLPWEAKLFNQGAGCPCCEGVKPEGVNEDDAWVDGLRDRLINGYDDYGQQDLIMENPEGVNRPKWERPDDKEVWCCNGCGVKVLENADDGEKYTRGPSHVCRELDHAEAYEPELERDGYQYCHQCVLTCDHCGEQYVDGDDCTYSMPVDCYEFQNACCEECLSALEHEQFEEAWSNYGESDLRKAWVRSFDLGYGADSLLDEVPSEVLRQWWFDHADEPHFMESDGIYIPISRYADKMTRQELGRLLWSVRRGEVTG